MSLLSQATEPSIEEIKAILAAHNCPHIDYDQVMIFKKSRTKSIHLSPHTVLLHSIGNKCLWPLWSLKVCVLWPIFDIMDFFQTEIKLNFVKQLRIKLSEKSLNRRFNVTMTSLPSDKDKTKNWPKIHLFQLRLLSQWNMMHDPRFIVSLQCTIVNPFVAGSLVLCTFIIIKETIQKKLLERVNNLWEGVQESFNSNSCENS